jgi:Flp pilus assembly pilin Flp
MKEQNIQQFEQEILELQKEKRTKSKGQSLVEYGLILALLSVVAISVLQIMGERIHSTVDTLNEKLEWAQEKSGELADNSGS